MNGQDILAEWRTIEQTNITESVFVTLEQWFDEMYDGGAPRFRVTARNTYRGNEQTVYTGDSSYDAKMNYYHTCTLLLQMWNPDGVQ